jgi:DNA-binding MarR family transcriptional regulator
MSESTSRGRPEQAELAWLRLARVFHKLQQVAMDDVRAHKLSLGQFDVLVNVALAEGMTQQEVADALLVTKSNVCQLLDRMEQKGLVERRQEGRSNHLFLTGRGRELIDRILPRHRSVMAEQLSALSSQEISQLSGLLRKLDRALP